ncbi:MAG: dockerin type I domain-containing protein [Saprospiraceae bacterium]
MSVSDGCGNTSVVVHSLPRQDCKAPTLICTDGLTATLMPDDNDNCIATLWATDFIASQSTDCGEDIHYAIYRADEVLAQGDSFVPDPQHNSIAVYMEDMPEISVIVYAIDESGNSTSCQTYLLVQPGLACLLTGAIGGMVMTEDERPVSNVTMSLSGPIPMTTMTDANGVYRFDDLEEDFDYTVTAFRNNDPLNGVTTFDIVLISKHILAIQPLNSPYKRIAADVNRSGTITTLDLIQMRKLILNIYTEFPDNTSWRFISNGFIFPQPENPWASFFPELININNLVGEALNAGFVAVKVGDVNGSASGD